MKSIILWLKIAFKTALCAIKFIKSKNRSVLKKWAFDILRISRVNVVCKGSFPKGSFIIMANHESYFDIFALLYCCDFDIIWFAKKELFKVPIFGQALKESGAIAVDRTNARKSSFAILKALKTRKENEIMLIFPQGTRKDKNVFKDGGILIAKKKKIPIVPLKITGSKEVLPYGKLRIKGGSITVEIFDKIDVENSSAKEIEKVLKEKIL